MNVAEKITEYEKKISSLRQAEANHLAQANAAHGAALILEGVVSDLQEDSPDLKIANPQPTE